MLASWIFWVIFSISLHELGHGWAAIRAGDNTPRETGHMTWNPIVHIGWFGLVAFAAFGLAWGAMPVNPSRFRGRHADATVAFAGPGMNLSLAVVCIVLGAIWLCFGMSGRAPALLGENLWTFFVIGSSVNLLLFALNLIPLPPLDGARILESFVPGANSWAMSQGGQMLALAVFVGVFIFLGPELFDFAIHATLTAIVALAQLFAG
jgi:Zn-dependent protease